MMSVESAFYVVSFLNGVAGAEDYAAIGYAVAAPVVPTKFEHYVTTLPDGPYVDWRDMLCNSVCFDHTSGVRGSGEALSLGHLANIIQRNLRDWEVDFLRINVGHSEWSVAAVILFINALPAGLGEAVFLKTSVYRIPLQHWDVLFKEWLVAIKRCPAIAFSKSSAENVLLLRKLLNLVYRNLGTADWAADYESQSTRPQVHYALTAEWLQDADGYVPAIVRELNVLLPQVVGNAASDGDLDSLEDWWAKRSIWAPGGASSDRSVVQHMYEDKRVGASDRPNKKVVFSELPDSAIVDAILSTPMAVGRGSVKNEPGAKDRCLWATNDKQFCVASYASHNYEKYANVDGIRAKQAPSDVVEWMGQSFRTVAPVRWLSLDYSDYNKEHEMMVLYALNVELASAWINQPVPISVSNPKMLASLWQAEAHLVKIAVGPDLPPYRVMGGLFTGCRDTARDHALLHWAYSSHALRYCQDVFPEMVLLHKNFTGDDEDTALKNWAHALLYLVAHMMIGHTIKAAKQICSNKFHEYLQRLVGSNVAPLRPLCTTLGALCSGQWAKNTSKWYDNIVQSISDSLWDAHARGLPLVLAQRWAITYIDRQMRVMDSDGISWKPLEWWVFRHGTATHHPLWYGTWGEQLPLPVVDASVIPTHATLAGVKSLLSFRRRQMPNLPLDEQNYLRLMSPDVYGHLYATERAKLHMKFAQVHWPIRQHKPLLDVATSGRYVDSNWVLANYALFPPSDRRPATLDEVLGRMGLDSVLVGAAGGLQTVLSHIPPSKLAKFEIPIGKLEVPQHLRKLDPAIQSVLSTVALVPMPRVPIALGSQARRLPGLRINTPFSFSRESPLTIVLAPNGSGKSTFCQHTYGALDFDELIASAHAQAAVHASSKHHLLKTSGALAAIEVALRDNEVSFICAQYPVWEYLRDIHYLPLLRLVIVNPPSPLLWSRLATRGWDEQKIRRRLDRWDYILANVTPVERAENLFKPHSLFGYDIYSSFDDLPVMVVTNSS